MYFLPEWFYSYYYGKLLTSPFFFFEMEMGIGLKLESSTPLNSYMRSKLYVVGLQKVLVNDGERLVYQLSPGLLGIVSCLQLANG